MDTLRIVGCFFVVLAHVAGGSADGFVAFSPAWWLCKGVYFLCLWTIPVFVMISGALLLNKKQPSIKAFYKKRLSRIGVALVFWTVFYLGVRLGLNHEALTVQQGISLVLQGNPYCHLWFLYMIAGLYLVTPFLQILVQHLSVKHCFILSALIMVSADIFHLCNVMVWGMTPSVFTLFVPYISYYILGYLIHHTWPRHYMPGMWVAIGLIASVVYLMCSAPSFIQLQSQQFGLFFFGFFGAPIAFMAIAIFWAFREACITPLSPRLKHLASCTMGIYVVHLFILKVMQILLENEASDQDVWIGLVLGSLIAFGLSYGLVSILKKIPVIYRIAG